MTKILKEQDKVIRRGDLVGYSKSDFDFHALVYEASGNRTLQEMLEEIKNKMRPISMHIQPILSELYADHLKILEAFKDRDREKAEKAFLDHNRQMIRKIEESATEKEWSAAKG